MGKTNESFVQETRVSLVAFTRAGCKLARRIAIALDPSVVNAGDRDIAWSNFRDVTPSVLDGGQLAARTSAGGQPAASQRDGADVAASLHYRVEEIVTTERISTDCGLASYGTSLSAWVADRFEQGRALVFVGASGIAVRAIAPFVQDKMHDPAVVSVDEKGVYVVPLLSGHVGGANDLARAIARITAGQAVISTATDVNGIFAVDVWAKSQELTMVERDVAKEVSARLLAGDRVGFASDFPVEGELPAELVGGATGADLPVGICVTLDGDKSPFQRTLHLLPRIACVGVGCKRDTEPDLLRRRVMSVLARAGIDPGAVSVLATIDVKKDELAVTQLAADRGWELRTFTAQELTAVPGDFAGSDFVKETVGVDNVCERAAVAASAGGKLAVSKQAADGVTVAVALADPQLTWKSGTTVAAPAASQSASGQSADVQSASGQSAASESTHEPTYVPRGLLSIVGLGPGARDDLTIRARKALASSELIVGYSVYVDLVHELYPDKPILTTPMRGEVKRCQMALDEAARGRHVAMVCSGDPGIYGMAGLCYELNDKAHAACQQPVNIEVIPGVTAANGGAAVLGAPLMHDFAVISLSDLMTPKEKIRARLEAAAASDMVIVLYNPSSRKRADYLRRACDIMLQHKSPETVCGIVRNIGREGQSWQVMTLANLREAQTDMFTTVYVGNASTRIVDARMVTPRGYKLDGDEGDVAEKPADQASADRQSARRKPLLLARLTGFFRRWKDRS